MVVHWDDVPWEPADHGEGLRWERRRLTPGLSRYRVAPGDRIMPVHVHIDEEEFVVVLAGSGVSWQDGAVYSIAAGDAVLHRPDAEAHTLIGGDDGLEVLIFASGSPTGLTLLPRAGVLRLGARLWPLDVADPFAAEALGGALEVPDSSAERPATIGAIGDVAADHTRRGRTDMAVHDVGEALGSTISGLQREVLAPRAEGFPPHAHAAEHEIFVVVGGEGVVRLGDDEHPVRRGSVVDRPAATRVAHSFVAGEGSLDLLAWGTRVANDYVVYPRSGKASLRGIGIRLRPEQLDYWDGEE
jgi:uncharacterized cupin superfamily protein